MWPRFTRTVFGLKGFDSFSLVAAYLVYDIFWMQLIQRFHLRHFSSKKFKKYFVIWIADFSFIKIYIAPWRQTNSITIDLDSDKHPLKFKNLWTLAEITSWASKSNLFGALNREVLRAFNVFHWSGWKVLLSNRLVEFDRSQFVLQVV